MNLLNIKKFLHKFKIYWKKYNNLVYQLLLDKTSQIINWILFRSNKILKMAKKPLKFANQDIVFKIEL